MNRTRGRKFGLAIASILALCGLAELTARIFLRFPHITDNLTPYPVSGRPDYYYLRDDRLPSLRWRSDPVNPPLIRESSTTVRIVVLGESSAHGTPYEPQASFAHQLGHVLRSRWPQVDVQVFNLAFPCQTYLYSARTAEDARAFKPHFYVIYAGNNETINLQQTRKLWLGWSGWLTRWTDRLADCSLAFRAYRTALLRHSSRRLQELPMPPDMSDENLNLMMQSYDANTHRILKAAKSAKAKVLFIIPLRDLKDIRPFAQDIETYSVTASDIQRAEQNATLDPTLHDAMGRYYAANGQMRKAYEHFTMAADVLPGTCVTRTRNFLRRLPDLYPNVMILDTERSFEKMTGTLLRGAETLTDSVHLRLDTHSALAGLAADQIEPDLEQRFGSPQLGPIDQINISHGNRTYFNDIKAQGALSAGMANLFLRRWSVAKAFLTEAAAWRDSLQPQLALATCELHLRRFSAADRVLIQVLRQHSAERIDTVLDDKFSFDEDLRARLNILRTSQSAKYHPGSSHARGLQATYWEGAGIPMLRHQVDPTLDFDWTPDWKPGSSGIPRFTAMWDGSLYVAEAGSYEFILSSDDGAQLWIDELKLMDRYSENGTGERSKRVFLSEGWHPIRVYYTQQAGRAFIKLEWIPLQGKRAVIPESNFRPESHVPGEI